MKKCWNEDPLKRPDALNIKNTLYNWYKNIRDVKITNINKEFYEADIFLKWKQTNVSTFKSYSQAYHTSRLLDFTKRLNEILNQMEQKKTTYLEYLDQKEE